MASIPKIYAGWLSLGAWEEADDILYISSEEEPLVEVLDWIKDKYVSLRYWITDKEATKEEATDAFTRTCLGEADVVLQSHYSEDTGYLWTDQDFNVGGHDLLFELCSYAILNKWLILEIGVVEEQ